MVRAIHSPAAAPTRVPSRMTVHPVAVTVLAWMTRANVVAMARVMPAVDTWLPRRALAGEFIRCRPSTKQTAAATYSSWVIQSKALMTGCSAGCWPGRWPLPLTAPVLTAAGVSAACTGVRERLNILSIRPVTT